MSDRTITRKTNNTRSLTAMALSYCLGVFNDNYFKQAAMLLAVAAGLNHLQGWATILFALPFILFSAHGGWCADRFSKKNVIVASKAMEIVAMAIGATGLITGNWYLILAMVFCMGLQSSFFGPSLNGSIPEQFPTDQVPKVNAIFKLISTLAILAGMAAAGISLDQHQTSFNRLPEDVPFGIVLVAGAVLTISLLGLLASIGVKRLPAADSSQSRLFPWFGPYYSIKDLAKITKDRDLLLAVSAYTWFYFIASIIVLVVNSFGLQQLGLTQTKTSLLSVSLMIGVCIGAFLAARLIKIDRWSTFLTTASLGICIGLLFAGATVYAPKSFQFGWLVAALTTTGIAGGLFLIPVTSFLQIRPSSTNKGRVIAAAGFCSFSAILLSGIIYTIMEPHMNPSVFMTILGLLSLLFTCSLFIFRAKTTRISFIESILRKTLSLRYSVKIKGLDQLDLDESRGTIFLPNHPALIDPVIVMSAVHDRFAPRPLSVADQIDKPVVRQLMKLINPIVLPRIKNNGKSAKDAVQKAMNDVVTALNQGENILFYPAGRLTRTAREDLRSNSGVEYIVDNVPDVQIVLVRTTGLWGSSFSHASGKAPTLTKHITTYLKALFANCLFFGPKREVYIEFQQNNTLSQLKDRNSMNRYLESYYNQRLPQARQIPYFWWQGSKPVAVAEISKEIKPVQTSHIPASIQNLVMEKLEELSGSSIERGYTLANDLGLDSLTILELSVWLEQEFGITLTDPAILESVDDCILAANGQLGSTNATSIQPPPSNWFASKGEKLSFPQAKTITENFLLQAGNKNSQTILADQISGSKSYFQIITAIFALLPKLDKLPGERIGIMLPASASSAILYLAALFSGKTPVLFNWTSGKANMAHGIEEAGVHHILTAGPLCTKIEQQQGISLNDLDVEWVYLDKIIPKLTIKEKAVAFTKALFGKKELGRREIPETAAILFTSGSEAKPKAVPLSHKNILTNMRDFSSLLEFDDNTRLLGMLPPFHSLGLVGTIIMPLCLGLRTVYHANPTEPVKLAALIDSYKVSMLVSTPTFLSGILQSANPEQLKSLKLTFTGAEKCPNHVREKLAEVVPHAELCEGYGITECSPLVSINLPGKARPGTIGKVLPSIDYAIVDDNFSQRVEPGKRGQLLLKGDSIFSGYLNCDKIKGFCSFEDDIWYQTGDYVSYDEQHLVFQGRKKRFIKIAGEMISLPAIENSILQHVGSQTEEGPLVAVEATPAESHPEIVLFSTKKFERDEINTILRNAGLSALHNIRRLVQVDSIPVLGTGKTDYKQLQQLLTV